MMEKLSFIGAILLLCSGCASTQQDQAQLALTEQYNAAYQRCKEQYPAYPVLEPKTAVASVKCFNRIPRPVASNSDLFELANATRLAVAEKLEKGQVTQAEAQQQIASETSHIMTEWERRRLAERSVAAMEAAAAPKRPTCVTFNNSVTCY
jgi:hypothetical protein